MINRVSTVWGVLDGWGRLALVALVVAALGQVLFVGKYATRPWRFYRVGRALMGKSASLAVVLLIASIGSFYRLWGFLEAGSISAVAAFIWYQTWVLWTSPRFLDDNEYERRHE